MTTVGHDLYNRTAQYISDSVKSQYERVLNELYAVYKNGDFNIEEIHCVTMNSAL